MNRVFVIFAAALATACGQTASESQSGTGGQAGADAGGASGSGASASGGAAGASAVECVGPHWKRLAPPPGGSYRHDHSAAAWGSDQILIWGGGNDQPGGRLGTGWRVFADGSAIPLPIAGAPSPRAAFAIDVLGNRLLIWGGDDMTTLGDGAWLDLDADEWHPLPSPGQALAARSSAFSGVVESKWLIWGGGSGADTYANGALYDPADETWVSTKEDAPGASALAGGTALASGGPKVGPAVFGGAVGAATMSNLGYGYNSVTSTWWKMASEAAPSARSAGSLTWSSSTNEFIVWGGAGTEFLGDGARFSIVSASWKSMSVNNAPAPRVSHHAAMLGSKLIVFGGDVAAQYVADGGVYDVTTDTWESLPLDECAPTPRLGETVTAFGNGKQLLVWGGSEQPGKWEFPPEQGWVFTL